MLGWLGLRSTAWAQAAPTPATSVSASASPAAVSEPQSFETVGGHDIDWGRQIFNTVVGLVVVCGLVLIVLRLLYARAGMGWGGGGKRLINVLDRHVLSQQKAIVVVSVAGKVLVLGMTEHNINTLAELDPQAVDAVPSATPLKLPFTSVSTEENPLREQLIGLFGKKPSAP